jgi:hypothetical protein
MIAQFAGGEKLLRAIIKIIAKNPPSIAIVLAGLLALTGQCGEATLFLGAGILLQIFWLIGKYFL